MNLLILGLGNPGNRYQNTRHNAGFIFLDFIAKKYKLNFTKKIFYNYEIADLNYKNSKIYFVKSTTFMNNSGTIINQLFRKTGITVDNCVVIVDNMDLEFGKLKLKKGGGSAGHNGLKSIISNLGSSDFYRLYVGIGRPEYSAINHVLTSFSKDELEVLNFLYEKNFEHILDLSNLDFQKVSNAVNSN